MKTSAYVIAAAVLFAGAMSAGAQNLAPSVTVTNDFANSINETGKQSIPISIPDSIRNNVPKFDYSVFPKPYRGSYKFSPYNVKINLPSDVTQASRLYVKAGAGYSFHPEFKLVAAPFLRGRLKMSIYQDFHGYGGGYHILSDCFDRYDGKGQLSEMNDGYDYSELFGLEGTLGLKKAAFSFNFGYEGVFAGLKTDVSDRSAFHSVFGVAGVKSVESPEKMLNFDAKFLYRLGYQNMAGGNLTENQFKAYGWFAPVSLSGARLLMDYEIGYAGCGGVVDFDDYIISTTPRLAFSLWVFDLSTGFKVSYIGDDVNFFPDLRLSVRMFGGHLELYGIADGGENINLFSDFKKRYHHFGTQYVDNLSRFGATGIESVNARGGIRGSIADRLQFDVRACYAVCKDMPVDCVRAVPNGTNPGSFSCLPGIAFEDYEKLCADATLSWTGRDLDLLLGAHYCKSDIEGRNCVLGFPTLTGDIDVTYNYHRRLFAGFSVEASTERKANVGGTAYSLPAFVDVGVHGEYVFGRVWSAWVRAYNLLDQNIQREPFFCEKGPAASIGITLKLK